MSKPIDAEFAEVKPETSLVLSPGSNSLVLARDPKDILADAKKAADALMEIIKAKPPEQIVKMNNKQYLVFEDWQTVGTFFGLTPRIREDKLIQINMPGKVVTGYESFAEVVNSQGRVISSATAMCLNDEEKWSSRAKYEYLCVCKDGSFQADPPKEQIIWEDNPNKKGGFRPKKQRVVTGTTEVPLFQLRSMAQTRACAKALRNALAWVVVLAGFQPTPAEEMDTLVTTAQNEGPTDEHPPRETVDPLKVKTVKQPKSAPPVPVDASQPQDKPNGQPAVKSITRSQQVRFLAIGKQYAWTEPQLRQLIKQEFNIEHTADIPVKDYNRICDLMLPNGPQNYSFKEEKI